MAKDIQIKYKNEQKEWEELYPKTKTRNITDSKGESQEEINETLTTQLTQIEQNKVDRNGSGEITWGMLDQNTREQVLGDTPPAVVGRNSVGRENLTKDSATATNIDFFEDNTIDAQIYGYTDEYILGTAENGGRPSYRVDGGARRSLVIPVEPNTHYEIVKEPSNVFRIGVHTFNPEKQPLTLKRFIKDEHTTGIDESEETHFEFTTQHNEHWIIIYVSTSNQEPTMTVTSETIKANRAIDLKEESLMPRHFKFNQDLDAKQKGYVKSGINGRASTNPNPTYLFSEDRRSILIPVEPFKTYEIHKEKSLLFRIGANSTIPLDDEQTLNRFIKDEDTTGLNESEETYFRFMTRENDNYIVVYVSNDYEEPEMVIKEVQTAQQNSGGTSQYIHLKDYANGDGITDDSIAIQQALNAAKGKTLYMDEGEYIFTQTLVIRHGTTIIGDGDSCLLKLGDNPTLSPDSWREHSYFPFITTEDGAENVMIDKAFRLSGHREIFFNERHWGLVIKGAKNVVVSDITISHINFFPEDPNFNKIGGGQGWGLVIYQSEDVNVTGGKYEYCAYENIGTEDVDNVKFIGVTSGVGGRTSVQFHRGSKNIKLIGCTINQNEKVAHSSLTFHGSELEPVENILVDGLTLKSITNGSTGLGGIQSVDGYENDVTIVNSDIEVTHRPLATATGNGEGLLKNWIFKNNRVKGHSGLNLNISNLIVKDNIIDTVNRAINVNGDNYIVDDNILLNNNQVTLNGIAYE